MDVKNGFLIGELTEDVYKKPPPSYGILLTKSVVYDVLFMA